MTSPFGSPPGINAPPGGKSLAQSFAEYEAGCKALGLLAELFGPAMDIEAYRNTLYANDRANDDFDLAEWAERVRQLVEGLKP